MPDSENHLENNECAFISNKTPPLYLSELRIKTFCANALHKVVLPIKVNILLKLNKLKNK